MDLRVEWYNDHRGSAGFGSHSPWPRKTGARPFGRCARLLAAGFDRM